MLSELTKVKKNLNYFTFHSEILSSELTLFPIVLHDFHTVERANVKMFAMIFEKFSIAMTEDVVRDEESEENLNYFTFHSEILSSELKLFPIYRFTRFPLSSTCQSRNVCSDF